MPQEDSASSKSPTRKEAPKKAAPKKAQHPKSNADVASRIPTYFVGIGASAGGLEALRPFVANLPETAGMTYIVAQHMSPDHRSLMVELLARETKLKVEEAKNGQAPLPNAIYVAPPNTDVTVMRGKLHIGKPTNTIGPKPSVDRFFMSLASDLEDRAVGIILSGTGSDGAHGIKAIKAAGGISIAQEPKSAKYDSMPNAAIRIGGADLVLPPGEIANQLTSIITRPLAAIAEDADPPPSTIRGIVQQIASHTGMDFTNYKDATLSRQIMRRMTAKQIPNLEAYGEYIGKHHEELLELANNFLICVTSFFRDLEAFAALRPMLQGMLEDKKAGDEIRIWVPGCATGEEVYSIAILLSEELGASLDKFRVQIFATDVNNEAVQAARLGIYPGAALVSMQDSLIRKYFLEQDGAYHINKKLKDMVLFARQDLVQDPPFVRLDMVSCRNLLIYFKPDLQDRVLKIFHYTLRDNGILFLGKSETVGRQTGLFAETDRKNKLYIRRRVATPMLGSLTRGNSLFERNAPPAASAPAVPNSALGQERLFELYAPPSLLFTEEGEILEIYGDCSSFLAVRKGKADFNLFTLISPPFRAEVRAFAHRVARGKESAYGAPVTISVDGQSVSYRASMHFVPQHDRLASNLLLLSFERTKFPERKEANDGGAETAHRISELEQEVVLTRENLQTVIEELETANEELQSLNEEAQAANEELQASNEELETANEELQASNEELITVNDELGSRSAELAIANDDLTNILNSMYKGLIVVDSNLMITRANKVAQQFFSIPTGANQNIATLKTHYEMPGMLEGLQKVMKHSEIVELEFGDGKEKHFLLRLTPYVHNAGHFADGAVMTILDISERKAWEEKLKLSASVFEHASEATLITDADNNIISVNPAFTRITGYAPDEVIGKNPRILSSGMQDKEFYARMWDALVTKGVWNGEIRNKRKNGQPYTEWLSVNVLKDQNGRILRHIGVFSDITDSKKAQETIERQANFDNLTSLPNRNLTMDRLGQLLLSARRENRMFGVLFMDLDNFKAINDSLGHHAGDDLLAKVAMRIKGAVRDVDSVGRMGGDEFIVLLPNISSTDDALVVANKILAEVHQPLLVAGHTVQTAASIGITIYPVDGDAAEALLKNADNAMYEAKKNGRNTACFYTHQMQDESNRRHWILQELSGALRHNRLQVHYQPIIDIQGMRLHGAEALTRWVHPHKGHIPPDQFIPIAEQNGLIAHLSDWMIESGLRDAAAWSDGLSVSLNLSVAQFVSRDHINRLLTLLKSNRLVQQQRVTLEITESMTLLENDDYRGLLHKLRDCGVRLAIDDFGTGYSSLNYLKRIPVDIVKIDRTFVRDILTDEMNRNMVHAVLQMAKAFKLTTVAEGVETAQQLEFLKQSGCDYAQGFLFSQPLPHKEFVEYDLAAVRI